MKRKVLILLCFLLITSFSGCAAKANVNDVKEEGSSAEETAISETGAPGQKSEKSYTEMEPEEICASLSLEQKAAQMMEPTIYHVDPSTMQSVDYGSILSKYENWPMPTAQEWKSTVTEYQTNALRSDAAIPFFYGNDSVHGVNFASGCVIFPHNINIGAANDPELTQEYGKVVGSDIVHTGMLLNFSPCVATARDPRWGRTYESYSSDCGIVKDLACAYSKGLLSEGVLVCAKHFFGDGCTLFGTGEDPQTMLIDRGDAQLSDEQIADQLAIYKSLIDEGVQVIMLSHSSLNGTKMHENAEYIDRLKNELGFKGIVLSDWDSILNCSGSDYRENVILCVNAGLDMLMTDYEHDECMNYIIEGVNEGLISEDRINDAVTRIIRVKKNAGLFEDPLLENMKPSYDFNSKESHDLARKLASKSFVRLKNGAVPSVTKDMKVFVTGPAADDMGVLCGGWTYFWQGASDTEFGEHFAEGNTILDALKEAAQTDGFEVETDPSKISECDLVLLCVGEKPYAEWYGDAKDISLTGPLGLDDNKKAMELAESSGLPVMALIVAGRNVIINDHLDNWDSCMMIYLPGSEGGNAVADVLTGKAEAEGSLPMPYYTSTDQIGTGDCWHETGWRAR